MWVETDVFELVEVEPANKLFVPLQLENILLLCSHLVSILEDNFVVTKVVSYRR